MASEQQPRQSQLQQQEERDRARVDASHVIWERKRYYCCFGWQRPLFHAGWVDGDLRSVPKGEHPETKEYRAVRKGHRPHKVWPYKILVNEHTDPHGWQYGRWTWRQLRKLRAKGRNRQTHPDLVRRRQWVHRDCADHILSAPSTAEAHAKRGAVFVLDPVEMAQRQQEAAERNHEASKAIKELLRELQQRMRFKSLAFSLLDPVAMYAVTQRHIKAMQALQARALHQLQPAYVAPTEEAARELGGRPGVPPTWQHWDANHLTDTSTSPAVPEHAPRSRRSHADDQRRQSIVAGADQRQHSTGGGADQQGRLSADRVHSKHSSSSAAPQAGAAAGTANGLSHGAPNSAPSAVGRDRAFSFGSAHDLRGRLGSGFSHVFKGMHDAASTQAALVARGFSHLRLPWRHAAPPPHLGIEPGRIVLSLPELECATGHAMSVYGDIEQYLDAYPNKTYYDAVMKVTGVPEADVLKAVWRSNPFQPAHYVAVDHGKNKVVVCVRGTFDASDRLTDLVCRPVMHDFGVPGMQGLVHTGILRSALNIVENVRDVVCDAVDRHPDYDILLTGHSLGGGTAALLAMMLRYDDAIPERQRQRLRCIALAPVAAFGAKLDTTCQDYVASIVYDWDMIPRVDIVSMAKYLTQLSHHSPFRRALLLVHRAVKGLAAGVSGKHSKQQSELTSEHAELASEHEESERAAETTEVGNDSVGTQHGRSCEGPCMQHAETCMRDVHALVPTGKEPTGATLTSVTVKLHPQPHPGPIAIAASANVPADECRAALVRGAMTANPSAATIGSADRIHEAARASCEETLQHEDMQSPCCQQTRVRGSGMPLNQLHRQQGNGCALSTEQVHDSMQHARSGSASVVCNSAHSANLPTEIEAAALPAAPSDGQPWREHEDALQHALQALQDVMKQTSTDGPRGDRPAPAVYPETEADATALVSTLDTQLHDLPPNKHEQQAAQQAAPLIASALQYLQQLQAWYGDSPPQASALQHAAVGMNQQGPQPLAMLQARISTDLNAALAIMQEAVSSGMQYGSDSMQHAESGPLSRAPTCPSSPQLHSNSNTKLCHASEQPEIDLGTDGQAATTSTCSESRHPDSCPHPQQQPTEQSVPLEAQQVEDYGGPASVPAGKASREECGNAREAGMTAENKDGLLEPLQLPGAVYWLVRDTRLKHKRVGLGAGGVFAGMQRFFRGKGKGAAGPSSNASDGAELPSSRLCLPLGLETTEEEADTGNMDDPDPRHMGKFTEGDDAKPSKHKQLPLVLLSADDSWFVDLFITWKALHDHIPQKYDQAMCQFIAQEKLKMRAQ